MVSKTFPHSAFPERYRLDLCLQHGENCEDVFSPDYRKPLSLIVVYIKTLVKTKSRLPIIFPGGLETRFCSLTRQ
jgi:hypothetical protein